MATKKKSNLFKDAGTKIAVSLVLSAVSAIGGLFIYLADISADIKVMQERAELITLEFRERFDNISGHREKVEGISDRLSKVEWEVQNHLEIHQDDKEDKRR